MKYVLGLILVAFLAAICISWIPMLTIITINSIFIFIPTATWAQVTFFTWIICIIYLVINK